MHYGASVSEVAECTAAKSHSSRATQTRGGCIGKLPIQPPLVRVYSSNNNDIKTEVIIPGNERKNLEIFLIVYKANCLYLLLVHVLVVILFIM